MDTLKIYNNLNCFSPITEESWADLQEIFEPFELKKNEYLLREGSMAIYCNLLIDGIVRVFFNKDGNEYNKTFFTPGMFPIPLTALLSEEPSALSFQALLRSNLIRFRYKKFRELFYKHRCLETFMLAMMEKEWIKKEKQAIQMVTNDATTNYLIFKKEYPDLENLIPQYHIASYLGITPIQLSRIRARITKSE